MKRYQCIKNYYVTLTYGRDVTTAAGFKAGKPYNFTYSGQWWEAVDEFGTTHIATDGFMAYFKDLEAAEDLPIPDAYWDHDSQEYFMMSKSPGCTPMVYCTLIAFILTVLALIFFR